MTSNRSRKQLARDFRSQMRSSNNENDNTAHPGSISDRVSKLRVQLDEIKANCKITDKKKTTFKAKYVEDETVAALDEDEVEVEVPLPIETEDEDSTSNDARWFEMCTEDEIKKDEKELELSIAAIMKNISEGKPIDIQDFMKATFMTLFGPFSHLNINIIAKKVLKIRRKS